MTQNHNPFEPWERVWQRISW